MPDVIIPKFTEPDNNLRYFVPRFVKIQRGQTVKWTNLDIQPHILSFYYFIENEKQSVGELGPIMPNKYKIKKFDFSNERIDYYCRSHPNERGSVVIFQTNEESMTNTERLNFLSRNFGISRVPL